MTAPLQHSEPGSPTPAPDRALRDEVLNGLRNHPKRLPPKLFYDETGARLFERITTLPEYYLTRAELEILRARAGEIAELAGPRCALVEYGSGAGVKVRLGTQPAPHAGIGVAQYAWATSPLRRYVDLVNQWQIVACARHGRTAGLVAPFKPKPRGSKRIVSLEALTVTP